MIDGFEAFMRNTNCLNPSPSVSRYIDIYFLDIHTNMYNVGHYAAGSDDIIPKALFTPSCVLALVVHPLAVRWLLLEILPSARRGHVSTLSPNEVKLRGQSPKAE